MKNELLPFDSELHEDLFKLFILESNGLKVNNPYLDEYAVSHLACNMFRFQFSDRSYAPMEHEDHVGHCFAMANYGKKIIFRFEENNLVERPKKKVMKYLLLCRDGESLFRISDTYYTEDEASRIINSIHLIKESVKEFEI